MISLCGEAGLPEPIFEQRHGSFVITIWRNWLTDEYITSLDLNDRQLTAIKFVKQTGKITNSKYQELIGVTRKTSMRDLNDLINQSVFELVGEKRGAYYVILKNK